MPEYTVKNVKSFRGREGYGFNCTLYRDGKRVATVDDAAHGGDYHYHWLDFKEPRVEVTIRNHKDEPYTFKVTSEEKILCEHTDPMFYDKEFDGKRLRMGNDGFVNGLVAKYEENKDYKKWCRKETCFRLKGDEVDKWRTLRIKYSDPRAKSYLANKYGDKVEEILNERFEKVKV